MAKEREVEYVPVVPTKVLTASRGNARIVNKLYGDVTFDRLVREQHVTDHRADQLNNAKPPRARDDSPFDFGKDDYKWDAKRA